MINELIQYLVTFDPAYQAPSIDAKTNYKTL